MLFNDLIWIFDSVLLQNWSKTCNFFNFLNMHNIISAGCCVCVFSVHEGTLVHAVSVLSQWTGRLTVDVPSELREWFKKAFTLKTSTSLVRQAYLQAMLGAFKGQSLCWDVSHGFKRVLLMFCQNKQRFCVSSSCSGDTLSQAVDFLPLLIQTVEKAAAQNTQHALLAEGVTASVLLCRLSMLDSVSGEHSH